MEEVELDGAIDPNDQWITPISEEELGDQVNQGSLYGCSFDLA